MGCSIMTCRLWMAGATSWTCVDVVPTIHNVTGHDDAAHVDDYLVEDTPTAEGSGLLDVICEESSSGLTVRDNPVYNLVSDSTII